MRTRLRITSAVALAVLVALAVALVIGARPVVPDVMSSVSAGVGGSIDDVLPYEPGEVMVRFRSGVEVKEKDEIASAAGAVETLKEIGPAREKHTRLLRLSQDTSVEEAVASLGARSEVLYAEPNYFRRFMFDPDDPAFPNQWGLHNTGQKIGGVWGEPDADINAREAWDIERGLTNPVTVAVLDSGINLGHEDLDSRVWQNQGENPPNGVDDDSPANGYIDDYNGYNFAGLSQSCFYSISGMDYTLLSRDFGESVDTQEYAQSITGNGCDLTDVGIRVTSVGTPTEDIRMSVRTVLDQEATEQAHCVIPHGEVEGLGLLPPNISKELSEPVHLDEGDTYYLVFETENCDTENHYELYENLGGMNGDIYSGGHEYQRIDSVWEPNTADDFCFKTNPNRDVRDDNGHGTYVSGIIGAECNDKGMTGISHGARIMPLKVMDASGVPSAALNTDEVCSALYYAADNGARVVSMSLGSYLPSEFEQDAIDYAHGQGVVMAAAAGNDGNTSVLYPAGCDHVIGVGATNNLDQKASFSNYNSTVDVTAPGQSVYSTSISGGYGYGSGTSAATPHVAGLAALVLSHNPALNPEQVEQVIESNARDLGAPGRDDYYGFGRIDALETLKDVTSLPYIDSVSPSSGPVGTEVAVSGINFGSAKGSSTVRLNGTDVDCGSWGNTQVKFSVPQGTETGPVQVITDAGASNGVTFTVTEPPSPEPDPQPSPASTWYLAEGTTAYGFDSYITIENPNTEELTAQVTYMTDTGPVERDDVILAAMSQTTINPRDDLGDRDFSTMVACAQGRTIAVDRTMSWTGEGAQSPDGHCSVGVTSPATTWYLAEGCSDFGFETWLLIQNPNDTEAVCTVTYMTEGEGPQVFEKRVPASSRRSYSMAEDIGAKNASIKVTSDLPVIPERAMYRNNRREGHDSIGTTTSATTYYLAEGATAYGFTTFVLVQNPNDAVANVTLTYMTPDGEVAQPSFAMDPNSRKTVTVNEALPDKDVSTRADSDVPIIAERAMYWGEGTELGEACHDSVGMSGAHTTFHLPDGQTSDGHETWTLVQNPNDTDVEVRITYLTPTGKDNTTFYEVVPANSRRTFKMAEHIPNGRASIMVTSTTPGMSIMCERAMYWNGRGAGTDTIGGFGD